MGVVRGTRQSSRGSDNQLMEGRSAGAKGLMSLVGACKSSLDFAQLVASCRFEKIKQLELPWETRHKATAWDATTWSV